MMVRVLAAGVLAASMAGSCLANDLALDRDGRVIPLDHPGGHARPRQVYILEETGPSTIENPDETLSPRYVTRPVYPEDKPDVLIRVANGGAGAAGLIEALAHAYLGEQTEPGAPSDIGVGWYLTDTTFSLKTLRDRIADIAITYNEPLELEVIASGAAVERQPVFMDHFMLVGPVSNPAGIAPDTTTEDAFAAIIRAGCPTRFDGTYRDDCAYLLSRDDESATEIKERSIFDQTIAGNAAFADLADRAFVHEPWYFHCPRTPVACFPPEALNRANRDRLYTLTDWGTWLANGGEAGALPNLAIYVSGREPAGQPLLFNPAAALLSAAATPQARAFYDWLLAPDGGQAVIAVYGEKKLGEPLYTPQTPPIDDD